MPRRLILDTSVLVAFERGELQAGDSSDDIAIAAISLAEFATGAELSNDDAERAIRERKIERVLDGLNVLTYTMSTARCHARLLASVKAAGRPRSAHDLMIAAHALETGRQVATLYRKARFADLPGVVVADLSA